MSTAEEQASQPAVKLPQDGDMRETVDRVTMLRDRVRAMRALRWWNEWPLGHSDRHQPPRHVTDFQIEFGTLPESAEKMLGGEE